MIYVPYCYHQNFEEDPKVLENLCIPVFSYNFFSYVGGVSISECRRDIKKKVTIDPSDNVGFVSGMICFFCVLKIVAKFRCMKSFK